ncbi:hypothetical protein [Mycobacterium uberis]|uniref:hypothetical protein n=1 Tax=Mycobacterium uberis TaxID=2162698 RepID=UPI000E300D49|nr:hypothetical protein [Mycobacterium uberis]
MRVASDEARHTEAMAREETDSLTHELRDEVEAARQDRATASAVLACLLVSAVARRGQILAEVEEIMLQVAHNVTSAPAWPTADEDERHCEAQHRLDQQIKSHWEPAETQIVACEELRVAFVGFSSSVIRSLVK